MHFIFTGAFGRALAVLVAVPLAGALGCVDNVIPEPEGRPPQCDAAGYVAFDEANHAAQDVRLAAVAQMKELLEAAVAVPAEAAAKAAAAEDLYRNSAELQAKVIGRTDDHFAEKPAVGVEIDARILAALEAAAAATTAYEVEVQAEIVDKAFTEFFFLSILHELLAGQAVTWDEAYGYYGSGSDNDLGSLLGFAAVAKKRDDENATALEALVFQKLVDGSCVLAERLAADEVEVVDVRGDAELSKIVETIDGAMTDVLAYSVGHEAWEIDEAKESGDVQTASVKLVELDGFFRPLERLMQGAGGDSAARATSIRNTVDAALAAVDGGDDTWLASFDTSAILLAVETERSIEVRQ